jgi:transcription factor Ssl1
VLRISSLFARHKKIKSGAEGYICPRCKVNVCELPTECRTCGLTLVSSPHLARSYHHLFPVTPFDEVCLYQEVKREDKIVSAASRAFLTVVCTSMAKLTMILHIQTKKKTALLQSVHIFGSK